MRVEQGANKEAVQPGQLYFLSHPGTELFSGYGLTTDVGRLDRMTGLLMVDRPTSVDPGWLNEIEARYGDYQLMPMTEDGERGILAQMRVEPESMSHLERFDNPLVSQFQQALKPLLENPPAPILKVRWDEEQSLWVSDLWIGLPPEMQTIFAESGEPSGPGCFAAQRGDGSVGFISHASDEDIVRFRAAPMLWEWELVRMPTAPLIRFHALILDNPYNPFHYEHFLNVDDGEQTHLLAKLVQQEYLSFDFYGEEYEYAYSKETSHPAIQRDRLQQIVAQAIEVCGDIPETQRNFDRAKALFVGGGR